MLLSSLSYLFLTWSLLSGPLAYAKNDNTYYIEIYASSYNYLGRKLCDFDFSSICDIGLIGDFKFKIVLNKNYIYLFSVPYPGDYVELIDRKLLSSMRKTSQFKLDNDTSIRLKIEHISTIKKTL